MSPALRKKVTEWLSIVCMVGLIMSVIVLYLWSVRIHAQQGGPDRVPGQAPRPEGRAVHRQEGKGPLGRGVRHVESTS
jgi:hypothetical protein